MKELGEYLKSTRISNSVSIEEAADDLDLSTSQLENIENGNIRAFKDVYTLRQYVSQYAKYLGLNPEKISEEFNDFLFEHTSKISLDDILEAKRKIDEKEQKKVVSPYTIIPKKKVNIWPFVLLIFIIVTLFLIIYITVSIANRAPIRDNELISNRFERKNIYEFTY